MNKTCAKYMAFNVLGMIGLSCYILADTFFVARGVGADGLAALNIAIPLYSLIHGLGLMVGMGGATRFSISGTPEGFTHAMRLVLTLSAVFVAAGLCLSGQLATLLGSNAQTHHLTRDYLQVILLFAPMFMLNNLVICFVRNDGAPRLAMLAMLTGSLANVVLDYLFIFPLGWGMMGAALATGISPIISLVLLSSHFIRRKNTFRLCRHTVGPRRWGDIASLGTAALITEVSAGTVMVLFNHLILGLEGNVGVAAYGIISNISLVAISIFTGIAQGIQPLLSDNYGRGNRREVGQILRQGIITAIAFAAVLYAAIFWGAAPIVAAFNRDGDPHLAAIAVQGLRVYMTALGFVGVNILAAACFSAMDQAKRAFVISVLRGFVVIIPTALLLSALAGMTGIWLTLTVTEGIVLLVSLALCISMRRS